MLIAYTMFFDFIFFKQVLVILYDFFIFCLYIYLTLTLLFLILNELVWITQFFNKLNKIQDKLENINNFFNDIIKINKITNLMFVVYFSLLFVFI
jgi:hypothetical protein